MGIADVHKNQQHDKGGSLLKKKTEGANLLNIFCYTARDSKHLKKPTTSKHMWHKRE
jgi:hypothetical protein